MTSHEEIRWRVLCVDDDPTILKQVADYITGEVDPQGRGSYEVTVANGFDRGLELLKQQRFDAAVLDVRNGEDVPEGGVESGELILRAIQETQFVPVIFYTALPSAVEDVAGPFVRVAEKTQGVEFLLTQLNSVFATGLPAISRGLAAHIDAVQKSYMWGFVSDNWSIIEKANDGSEIAYLLARRLGATLAADGVKDLIERLGYDAFTREGALRHPAQYYVYPPVSQNPGPGDILLQGDEYRVVLTPMCDFAQGNVDRVLCAKCAPLTQHPKFKKWQANAGKHEDELRKFLCNREVGRYFFLPSAFGIPDIVVDFQSLETIEPDTTVATRIASLDSPFSAAIQDRFSRYFGRVAMPDLDSGAVLAKYTAGA